jgi:branched-chain amino acid transport system substrate-binding protein
MPNHWKFLAAAALAASLAAPITAGKAADDNKPLIFSLPLPLTGPVAYTGALQLRGWQDSIDWINKNGGIRGRKIQAQIYDDEYNVNLAVAGFKKAVANGDVIFSGIDGTPAIHAIEPIDNETYHVLLSNLGNSSDQVDTKTFRYNLLFMPTYSDMFNMALDYVKKQKPDATIGFVYSDTQFGKDPIELAHKKADELGLKVVVEDITKFTGVDVTPTAIKLRNAAPDYVIIHGYAANVWPDVVKLSREYGVKSKFIVTIVAADPDLIKGVGEAADGILGVQPYNLQVKGSDLPVLKVMDQYLSAWKDKPAPYEGYGNIGYFQAWSSAVGLQQVIGATIDAGLPLNGDNLIKTAESMKELDMGGLYGPNPVQLVDHRIPYGIIYQYHVAPDAFSMEPVTDFIKE